MVVKFKDSEGYPSEIYSKGMTYSLLNNEYIAQHRPIRCKDFFQDLIWAEKQKQSASIYGFTWKPTGKVLTNKTLLIGVKDEGKDIGVKAKNCQKLLNKLEAILKYPKSKCIPDDTGKAIVTRFSTKWTEVPYVFSLFTLLLRAGLAYNNEPLEDFFKNSGSNKDIPMNDRGYLNTGMPKITKLLEGHVYKQRYEDYASISSIHNSSGICNYKP
jgi:hypothetical protein